MFSSVPRSDGDLEQTPQREVGREARAAVLRGEIDEIIWNHAPVGQYVTLRVPGTKSTLGFDVGRYDAFGIYRFERLAEIGSAKPELVAKALAPLLADNGAA